MNVKVFDRTLETNDCAAIVEEDIGSEDDLNCHEEGMEDFAKEMAKMNKIEQLREILKRLREFKRKGGEAGIDQKIGEVQLELRRHLREEIDTEESKENE